MTFDMDRVSESKREYRRRLAALPIEEKLQLLERMREGMLAIRAAGKALRLRDGWAVEGEEKIE